MDKNVRVWVGEEDHLRVQIISDSDDFSALFCRLSSLLDQLEACLCVKLAESDWLTAEDNKVFAWDREFGFLTSCPTNVGTGMRASVLCVLPLFAHHVTDWANSLGLQVHGGRGEASKVGSNGVVDVSPKQRFRLTEREILASLNSSVSHLLYAHRKMYVRALSIVTCAQQLPRLSWEAAAQCEYGCLAPQIPLSLLDGLGNFFEQLQSDSEGGLPDAQGERSELEGVGGLPPDSRSEGLASEQSEGDREWDEHSSSERSERRSSKGEGGGKETDREEHLGPLDPKLSGEPSTESSPFYPPSSFPVQACGGGEKAER
uniref:Phosphagen kinase C-terminal domain-containing protein n=1 Tax=Chromera velia CCMP2878 TaxID=1169474 RepID=A0A0K6S650_9ALVE|eukprot:Cvel_14611.t1-p1 / transcript=Cvel_14611.t1 / gene=Cvel_14611 / organism=Chromera_velia_CCMP2878 / gene_product=Arginine kinase, putative / transcript_product=Arginine kinase, putative / location=Cvel_scaffold1045:3667-4614(-) / protein_length=316 / sequence_SO=supercontig / SO=protein_coding / is_pseudo=false